jgi:hypothetical protein
MNVREITPERLGPFSEVSIRYERVMRVRNYFEDRKEDERVKIKKRETVVQNINSGKYDHIFKR